MGVHEYIWPQAGGGGGADVPREIVMVGIPASQHIHVASTYTHMHTRTHARSRTRTHTRTLSHTRCTYVCSTHTFTVTLVTFTHDSPACLPSLPACPPSPAARR